jgi:hypothetical protein
MRLSFEAGGAGALHIRAQARHAYQTRTQSTSMSAG